MVDAMSLRAFPTSDLNLSWFVDLFADIFLRLTPSIGLFIAGLLLTGVVITVSQTGFLWASKRIGFDFSRLNPLSGFKRLFSMQGVVELFKALLKLIIVGWVVYSFLRSRMGELLGLIQVDFLSALKTWTGLAVTLAIRVGAAYLVLAIADFAYQRWQFNKSMKMTKEEVREDMKRTEGNPQIKGRIRRQQRQMARRADDGKRTESGCGHHQSDPPGRGDPLRCHPNDSAGCVGKRRLPGRRENCGHCSAEQYPGCPEYSIGPGAVPPGSSGPGN